MSEVRVRKVRDRRLEMLISVVDPQPDMVLSLGGVSHAVMIWRNHRWQCTCEAQGPSTTATEFEPAVRHLMAHCSRWQRWVRGYRDTPTAPLASGSPEG